tara:strand:- start:6781 stop:7272 length:492 start_codon:yes stop_codon:yes gene_type:complete
MPLNHTPVALHDACFSAFCNVLVESVEVAENIGFGIEKPEVCGGKAPHQGELVFLFAEQAGLVDDVQSLQKFGIYLTKQFLGHLGQDPPQKPQQFLLNNSRCEDRFPKGNGCEGHPCVGQAMQKIGGACARQRHHEDRAFDALVTEGWEQHPVQDQTDVVPKA